MQLAPVTESLVNGEDHSWLASVHGFNNTGAGIVLDGAALGAIFTDGVAKSGTILAKHTGTGRYVPFDNATATNGLNVAAGILKTAVNLSNGSGGFVNSPAVMITHGEVWTAKLPRSAANTGGPHANAITGLPLIKFR